MLTGALAPILAAGIILATVGMLPASVSPPRSYTDDQATPLDCQHTELLVKFRPDADPESVAAAYGAPIVRIIPGIEVHVLAVPPGTACALVASLGVDPAVVFAEVNQSVSVPEDPAVKPRSCPAPEA